MGKVPVYNLGDEGVDLVSTPIHAKQGSWQRLQNGELSNIQGQGGIKKRGSLTRLNTVAGVFNGGANVLALFNMPLETTAFDTSSVETLLVAIEADVFGDPAWRSSVDGSTYNLVAAMTASGPQDAASQSVTESGVLYFVSGSGLGATFLYSWDGTTLTQAPAFPADPSDATGAINAATVTALSGVIYVGVRYAGLNFRVYAWTPGDLSYTQLGDVPLAGGTVGFLAAGLGQIWLLGADARILRINPATEAVWTVDHTFAGTSAVGTALCAYNGLMVAASHSNSDKTATIWTASVPGTWTSRHVFNGAAFAPTIGLFIPDVDTNGIIALLTPDPGPGLEAWVSDLATSWSLDFDLYAAFGKIGYGNGVTFGPSHNAYLTLPDNNGEDPFNGLIVWRSGANFWQAVTTPDQPIQNGLGVIGGT